MYFYGYFWYNNEKMYPFMRCNLPPPVHKSVRIVNQHWTVYDFGAYKQGSKPN